VSEYDDEAKRARFIQNVFDGDEAAFQQWYEQAKTEPPSEEELYRFKKTTFAAKRAAATWESVWESVVGTPFPGWTIEGLEEMAVAADLDFVEWKNGKFSGGEICRRAIDNCGGVPPEEQPRWLPKIQGDTVLFRGKTFAGLDEDACKLLQELVDAYPERIGLTNELRAVPRRVIDNLPRELQGVINTSNKGSVLKL